LGIEIAKKSLDVARFSEAKVMIARSKPARSVLPRLPRGRAGGKQKTKRQACDANK